MLSCWDAVVHYAQHVASGPTTAVHEVLSKLPLPPNLKSAVPAPTMIRTFSSNPAILPGMNCTVTNELIKILLNSLQTNFSIAIGPEVILQRPANANEDMKNNKNIVCIGSSILKQQIPLLHAAGYTVTDLTQPGWIATEDNINCLIKKMLELTLEPGFVVLLDLLGNCVYRYTQFDGTLALPYKEGGRHHFAGPVTLCGDENFKRIVKMLGPVLLSAQHACKILIPPLPRYVFNTCCSVATHCSNFADENYAEGILNGVSRLRNNLKRETTTMGMSKKWVLDGVGALLGTPVGQSYGTNREAIPELRSVLAKDGVHLETRGKRNLSVAIITAIENLRSGKNQCLDAHEAGTGTGTGTGSDRKPGSGISGWQEREKEFFWRGFTSPVGDSIGRATGTGGGGGRGHGGEGRKWHKYKSHNAQLHQHAMHPYKRDQHKKY
jgi:hypothetical protein